MTVDNRENAPLDTVQGANPSISLIPLSESRGVARPEVQSAMLKIVADRVFPNADKLARNIRVLDSTNPA